MSPTHPNPTVPADGPAEAKSEQPRLDDRLDALFKRTHSPAYRVATAKAYANVSLETALAGHDKLLSRCQDYLADPHLQELCREHDPLHDPAPKHPTIAHAAGLVVMLNRYLSGCRKPEGIAWARRYRDDFETAFFIPLSEMAAGEVRLRHRNTEHGACIPATGSDTDSSRIRTIDYQRYLRLTTPIRCRLRQARALVDFLSAMNVEEAYSCLGLAAKGHEDLQDDLDSYWSEIASLGAQELDNKSLTDLYIETQGRDAFALTLIFRWLLVLPIADLYRAGLLDIPAAGGDSTAGSLDRLLARAGS